MSSFTKAVPFFLLAAQSFAAYTSLFDVYKRDYDTFEWGAIGDSWASGVRGKPADDYVQGSQNCLLTNYAYGAQLEQDSSWAAGKKENFHFAACSGKTLGDMAKGQNQIGATGSPRLITMTAGGNNAGFYGIATDCIYQHIDKDYGPDYPDPESACAKSIQTSHDYIHRDYSEGQGGLAYDLNVTLADLMDTDQARSHIGFFLYLTGYAKFFDVSGNWCDNQSFGAKLKKPKLTLDLRNAINGLTQDLNDLYKQTIQDFPAHGMRFIDIDPGFENNRFCMEPSLLQRPWWFSAQYYGTYVWLWNLSVPASDNTAVDANDIPKAPPDDNNSYPGLVNTADIGPQGGGNEEGTPGWQQRPFHPKSPGYTAIKDAIIAQMKTDLIPESDPECTTPTENGSPTTDEAQTMNDALDAHGDDDCCAGDASKNESNCKGLDVTAVNGKTVDLCGDGTGQCIKCAQAANYLAGLITTCTQNGVVSAKQDVNGMPGLSIQI